MKIYLRIVIVISAVLLFIFLVSLAVFLQFIKPFKITSDFNPSDYNLEFENISFKSKDNLSLKGWFIPSNYSDAVVIVGHGFPFDKGNILPATMFLNRHYNLLYYDFRYFGDSEGKISTIAFYEQDDLLQAIEYAKSSQACMTCQKESILFSQVLQNTLLFGLLLYMRKFS